MARPPLLINAVRKRITRKRANVFLRSDFEDLGGYDQVGRVLRALVKEGTLVKIGYGLYAKTKTSALTGEVVAIEPLPVLAREALVRLNVPLVLTKAETAYQNNQSTQVPTGRRIGVRGRVTRKISFKNAVATYERVHR
jgi:Family of unknown function (DUF6088)